jgi:hypothetical protein
MTEALEREPSACPIVRIQRDPSRATGCTVSVVRSSDHPGSHKSAERREPSCDRSVCCEKPVGAGVAVRPGGNQRNGRRGGGGRDDPLPPVHRATGHSRKRSSVSSVQPTFSDQTFVPVASSATSSFARVEAAKPTSYTRPFMSIHRGKRPSAMIPIRAIEPSVNPVSRRIVVLDPAPFCRVTNDDRSSTRWLTFGQAASAMDRGRLRAPWATAKQAGLPAARGIRSRTRSPLDHRSTIGVPVAPIFLSRALPLLLRTTVCRFDRAAGAVSTRATRAESAARDTPAPKPPDAANAIATTATARSALATVRCARQ